MGCWEVDNKKETAKTVNMNSKISLFYFCASRILVFFISLFNADAKLCRDVCVTGCGNGDLMIHQEKSSTTELSSSFLLQKTVSLAFKAKRKCSGKDACY